MDKLFGIPIDTILYGSLGALIAVLLLLGVVALRNPVLFKMGMRNIARRPAQTGLIVLGLMLATLLISASLGTGDTMSYSIKKSTLSHLGSTDIAVRVKGANSQGTMYISTGKAQATDAYFSHDRYEYIKDALAGEDIVDAVTPVITERLPALSPKSRQNVPGVTVLGVENDYAKKLGALQTASGRELSIANLDKNEAYLNTEAADKLDVAAGAEIQLFSGAIPKSIRVAGIFETGGRPSDGPAAVMSVSDLQSLIGKKDRYNVVLISNKGDEIEGAVYTDEVVKKLNLVLEGTRLEAQPVKKNAIKTAEDTASMFTAMFLIFGEFSMIAGIMLIFLIFVMLAAERKTELGTLRALGSKRMDILRIFVFEGSIYAVLASAVGTILGLVVGWGMVKIMAQVFGNIDVFTISYYFNFKSLVIAYALGVLTTFAVVFLSAWRTGRINIVRAIRDLPEPRKAGRSIKSLIGAITLVAIGLTMIPAGIKQKQATPFHVGASCLIIGVPLLARFFRLPERAAFTAAGLGLLVWWLQPDGTLHRLIPSLPELKSGIEMFFVSGMSIVLGAIWAVMYNSDILLSIVVAAFGRIKGWPPILKIAVNYPMKNRFRTGMALAMFSLIIFTMVFMAAMISAYSSVYNDLERLSGGFHIMGSTSYISPVADVSIALDEKGRGIDSSDFVAIGSMSMAGVEIRQKGARDKKWEQFVVQGADAGYLKNTEYGFKLKADGYGSDREVWEALRNKPGLCVVHASLVPSLTQQKAASQGGSGFMLSGFTIEGKKLPDTYIEVKDPITGKESVLKVIGIIDSFALYAMSSIITSQQTVNGIMPAPVPATSFWFKVEQGIDVRKASKALNKTFYEYGMSTIELEDNLRQSMQTSIAMNQLMQGFMGLGLIIGIAALGVIAARSVVERRQQIGMLRAIGFRRGMVQNTFMLESSFVAVLGIVIGSALGLLLSYNVVNFMAKETPGVAYQLPWQNVLFIAVLAYAASLLTTYLPARQASKVYPAEALRYE